MKKIIVVLALAFTDFASKAQSIDALIDAKAKLMQTKLTEWRRHIHQHPELGNREFKTAEYIVAQLRQLKNIEVKTGIAKTGVVALLKGAKPGPCVALRADIDALPVFERVQLPFASKDSAEYNGAQVPVMHACGHDAHTAMLLGAAYVLSEMQNKISGTVKFIFQPAEEGPPGTEEGGAGLMVKEGVMENPKVDAIFGMHINSETPIGQLRYKKGAFMASADWLSIKVKGKQTHGSQPWFGIDPITVSAQIIEALQVIVGRQMNITKAPVVITIGKIHSGVRQNIIPEESLMEGTIRTLDSKMQQEVHAKIKHTAEKIAEASGATAEVWFDTKTLVTFNDSSLVDKMLPSLQKAAGAANVQTMNWVTGAEDFSYYGTKAPAFFFYIGGKPLTDSPAAPHHTPDFFIDDSKLHVGVAAFCNLVMDYGKGK
jgi:amidohydrolase